MEYHDFEVEERRAWNHLCVCETRYGKDAPETVDALERYNNAKQALAAYQFVRS